MQFKFRIYLTGMILFLQLGFALGQTITKVQGQIIDAATKESMLYVNIEFVGTDIGTTSDMDGNFYIETTKPVKQLKITYLGYKDYILDIVKGVNKDLVIEMSEQGISLQSIEITVEKYSNKGNPAVELIKNVIAHKDQNRKEGFDYYSFNKHEKVEFALNDITDKMKNNFIFRPVKFMFENVDTNAVNGKISVPFFMQETISDVYFRSSPKSKKDYIRAEKLTNIKGLLNGMGISTMMSSLYQEIDFYDNTIMLLTNGFVSPLSPLAPNIYRFYIQDTTVIKGDSMIHLFFAPRTKSDFAFMGSMWIAHDTTYALRKIEAGIPKDINLNFVRELQLSQEFEWVENRNISGVEKKGLMLSKDEIFVDFGLTDKKNARSVLGTKSITYRDVTVDQVLPDSIFDAREVVVRAPDALKKPESFWVQNRHEPLSKTEAGIYEVMDSLNNYKPFKQAVAIARLIIQGYTKVGPVDIGPSNTFYSFNPIEGFRGRLGGRTNASFSNNLMLEGYGAYGFKDKKIKGYAAMRYSFGKNGLLRFPYNQLKLWYVDDIRIPGQDLQFVQEDNLFLSFKRGVNDKMIYTATSGVEYLKEFNYGFSYSISAKNTRQRPAGALLFDYDTPEGRLYKSDVTSSELGVMLRYAPNEKFYEGVTYRTPTLTKFPIIEFRYAAGLQGLLNGEYNYQRINLKFRKGFFLPPFGYSILIVEGGRTFGQVPYTLLTQHRANQTYAYQKESYNLMNFLEFVSDKYASINYQHNFQGFFFGRTPLLKKLNWREIVTFKGLYGGLDKENIPSAENGLLRFPVDASGQFLTQSLGSKPYMEASVGIGNIFKLIRVDYVRRLTYTDLPNVSKWGIRTLIKVEF